VTAAALALAAALVTTGVGVDEHVGARVPLELGFRDSRGAAVHLGDELGGDRPALLVLAYARCTLLCSVVLRGVAEAVRAADLEVGRDYHLVLVSLDPRETVDEGARKQAALLDQIGRPGERWRWPYLTGDPASVARLAGALGFRYAWDARTEQYAHPAVVFILTPDGRIARYLYGVRFAPAELAASLRLAATGALVPAPANDVLRYFRFDPAARRWSKAVQLYFQIGASAIFALLSTGVIGLLVWERRRRP